MTISQILEKNYQKLKDAEIDSYILDAELLLAHVLKKSREYILTHPDTKLSLLQTTHYKLLTTKRINSHPIAYLTGHKEFYGLDFKVNRHTLVPRPETELMVEEALSHIATRSLLKAPGGLTFVDVGTGSGCIIISFVKKILSSYKLQVTNYKFFASDISNKALKTAKQNAKQNNVDNNIKFLHGNLLEPILKSKILNLKSKVIICANLPYLTPNQVKTSPSIQKEPKTALIAGNDGLKYYRELFSQIKKLKADNLKLAILCEIDPSQNKSIISLAKKYFSDCKTTIKKDLNKKDRLAIIEIK